MDNFTSTLCYFSDYHPSASSLSYSKHRLAINNRISYPRGTRIESVLNNHLLIPHGPIQQIDDDDDDNNNNNNNNNTVCTRNDDSIASLKYYNV
jgi:hypothetical protein